MANDTKTVSSSVGSFTRKENGLIYFYKTNDLSIDKETAEHFLELFSQLDDSGQGKLIVIQGQRVEYSFDAQRTLLTNKYLSHVAYVLENSKQYVSGEVLQDMAKTFQSHIKVGLFQSVQEAEAWLLKV